MRDQTIGRRALLRLFALAIAASSVTGLAAAKTKTKAGHRVRRRVVAVDAGHGGVDPGAISRHRHDEKTITLATARELARQLEQTRRYAVVLTRRADRFVPLRERVARARARGAELFVSIHADILPDPAIRGLSVYTLSEQASDREAAALAARENNDDFVGGVWLRRQKPVIGTILLDLARRETGNRSLAFAHAVVDEMGRLVPLLETPHRAAGFAVLTAPDMPSVLVELGCLSNAEDEKLLIRHAYQQRLAQGLMRAIDDYFTAYPAG